ncbi:unnamed protein product [Prunus brigantina]
MMNLGYPFIAMVTIWHDSVVACASGSGSSSSGVWILTGSVLLPATLPAAFPVVLELL